MTQKHLEYPLKEIHKDKDGHQRSVLFNVQIISNQKIAEAVNRAKERQKHY